MKTLRGLQVGVSISLPLVRTPPNGPSVIRLRFPPIEHAAKKRQGVLAGLAARSADLLSSVANASHAQRCSAIRFNAVDLRRLSALG